MIMHDNISEHLVNFSIATQVLVPHRVTH